MSAIDSAAWPPRRAAEALECLALQSGVRPRAPSSMLEAPSTFFDGETGYTRSTEHLAEWIVEAANFMGIEVEASFARRGEIEALLRKAHPAMIPLPDGPFVAILSANRWSAVLIGPDQKLYRVRIAELAERLQGPYEARAKKRFRDRLSNAGVPQSSLDSVAEALTEESLSRAVLAHCFQVTAGPTAPLVVDLFPPAVIRGLVLMLVARACQVLVGILMWWVIGRGVFLDRFEPGWIRATIALLFAAVPFQLLEGWHAGSVTLELGSRLKRRFLVGALRLRPDEIAADGAGHHLSRVIESEAMQALLIGGGFQTLLGVLEVIAAFVVLAFGAGGGLHSALLAGWCTITFVLLLAYRRRRTRWIGRRLSVTNSSIERMVGYLTRLIQEPPERWHSDEDRELEAYVQDSRAMDALFLRLSVLLGRGWLIVGCAGMIPALVGATASEARVAIALGGILLAQGAIQSITSGAGSLFDVAASWDVVAPLLGAASRETPRGAPAMSLAPTASKRPGTAPPLFEARAIDFRYRDRGRAVLNGCSFSIREGDRILVEGASGGGKSTLAALLSGLLLPESGLLLYRGLDWQTWGERGWRRGIVAAPQFHENHIFSETLAFNLLMGPHWPPWPNELEDADAVCRELGLGPLLDRMPSGLETVVGENGWQLSHGERSRIYIARAILRRPDLVVLDESFASLDASTLDLCLRSVLARSRTLVVVAHP